MLHGLVQELQGVHPGRLRGVCVIIVLLFFDIIFFTTIIVIIRDSARVRCGGGREGHRGTQGTATAASTTRGLSSVHIELTLYKGKVVSENKILFIYTC